MSYKELDDEIKGLKRQIQIFQEALEEKERARSRLTEIDNISHSAAVDKLREIYFDAVNSEDAQGFNLGVIEDEQLQEWFGKP